MTNGKKVIGLGPKMIELLDKVIKQEEYSTEIIKALESKIDKEIDPALKQKLFIKITQEMMDAVRIGNKMSASDALDNVLTEYDMLLEHADKLYGKEHLKKRIPKGFKKLINGMTFEEKEELDLVSNSVQGGSVELDDYEDTRVKKKSKKVNLSDWVPKI